MKNIYIYIKNFVIEDFNLPLYTFTIFFIITSIILNYKYNFFSIPNLNRLKPVNIVYYFIFYSIPYFIISIAQIFILNKKERFTNHQFWIKSIFFIFLISAGSSSYFKIILKQFTFQTNEYLYLWRISTEIKKSIICLIPLIIFKKTYDKNMAGMYGLSFKEFHIKPYIMLLMIVLPLIIIASFDKSFLRTYPIFKQWMYGSAFNLSKFQMAFIYETIYLLDFTIVELLFRGALVIGMISIIGKDAILPMTVTYVFLHFGKPVGETISSAFGGYILGIIAFNTSNISGGCFLHIGVAFFMNAAAHLQYFFRYD